MPPGSSTVHNLAVHTCIWQQDSDGVIHICIYSLTVSDEEVGRCLDPEGNGVNPGKGNGGGGGRPSGQEAR